MPPESVTVAVDAMGGDHAPEEVVLGAAAVSLDPKPIQVLLVGDAARIAKNPRPRVALLSNGTEEVKGPRDVVDAHRLLKDHTAINFVGNVEGVDIPRGTADVIVTSGFVGNVVLKMLEGVSETVVE